MTLHTGSPCSFPSRVSASGQVFRGPIAPSNPAPRTALGARRAQVCARSRFPGPSPRPVPEWVLPASTPRTVPRAAPGAGPPSFPERPEVPGRGAGHVRRSQRCCCPCLAALGPGRAGRWARRRASAWAFNSAVPSPPVHVRRRSSRPAAPNPGVPACADRARSPRQPRRAPGSTRSQCGTHRLWATFPGRAERFPKRGRWDRCRHPVALGEGAGPSSGWWPARLQAARPAR